MKYHDNTLQAAKALGVEQNVIFRVIDVPSGRIVQQHVGHNTATNSMLTGIGYYLIGSGVLNQGPAMLSRYIPQYISLGTMGLITQLEDSEGLPLGLGEALSDIEDEHYQELLDALAAAKDALDTAKANLETAQCCTLCETCPSYIDGQCPSLRVKDEYLAALEAYDEALNALLEWGGGEDEATRLADYMSHRPGYGADGYDMNQNNNRKYPGLGPTFANKPIENQTINCELISDSFPRAKISFRDVVPEIEAELPMTIDVVFSAMISTGALRQFREPGKDYLFITEAGLWGTPEWNDSGENGLLAGYRIAPSDSDYWYMKPEDVPVALAKEVSDEDAGVEPGDSETVKLQKKRTVIADRNRNLLKRSIIRVGMNQVVQVIWKIQIGSIDQLGGFGKSTGEGPILDFDMVQDSPDTEYYLNIHWRDTRGTTPVFTPNAATEELDITR